MAPSAQSCHKKKIGDWLRDTRTGMSTTTSRSSPKSRGIRPTSSTMAIEALANCKKGEINYYLILLSPLANNTVLFVRYIYVAYNDCPFFDFF